jgi:hypothetical protein
MNKYWHLEAQDDKDQNDQGPIMMAGSSDDSRVSAEHNKIYFYSGVTRQDNLALNKLLHSTGHKLANIQQVYKLNEAPKVSNYILTHMVDLSLLDSVRSTIFVTALSQLYLLLTDALLLPPRL